MLMLMLGLFAEAFQLLYDMTELQSRSQLQPHVLHHHVTREQHQSFAIDLLQQNILVKVDEEESEEEESATTHVFAEELRVRQQSWVGLSDVSHHVFDGPQSRVGRQPWTQLCGGAGCKRKVRKGSEPERGGGPTRLPSGSVLHVEIITETRLPMHGRHDGGVCQGLNTEFTDYMGNGGFML